MGLLLDIIIDWFGGSAMDRAAKSRRPWVFPALITGMVVLFVGLLVLTTLA